MVRFAGTTIPAESERTRAKCTAERGGLSMRHGSGHRNHESLPRFIKGALKTAQGSVLCSGGLEDTLEEHRTVYGETGTK